LLTAFIEILEFAIRGLKEKDTNEKIFFREIIEPVFRELEAVAEDYRMLFSKAQQALQQMPKDNTVHVLKELKENREEMLQARVKVRSMAAAIRMRVRKKAAVAFAEAVSGFFQCTNLDLATSRSVGERLVDLLELLDEESVSRADLIMFVEKVNSNLVTSWHQISDTYALLKLECIGSG